MARPPAQLSIAWLDAAADEVAREAARTAGHDRRPTSDGVDAGRSDTFADVHQAQSSSARLLVDVKQAARALGCGRTYIYELIATGQLTVVKLGRLTRIPVAALEDFVARRVDEATS